MKNDDYDLELLFGGIYNTNYFDYNKLEEISKQFQEQGIKPTPEMIINEYIRIVPNVSPDLVKYMQIRKKR